LLRHLTWALLLCLPLAMAQAVESVGDDPRQLVIDTSEKMLAKIREERVRLDENPQLINEYVIDIVLPHFDFEAMSRSVLGKHWRRADAGQRKRFVGEFRDLLVRTYATALLEYTEEPIDYLPLIGNKPEDDEVTVRSEIQQPGGLSIPIHYRMERQEGGWKVFDVTIDGLSLIGNYRTSFANEIRNAGLDSLIDNISRRNSDASGGG
jgi:phospholipid transport system substrate-binding protein